MTKLRCYVKREFEWQSHGQMHTHKDYLVGVRYPVLGNGPYCGPNPEEVIWVPKREDASSWDTEYAATLVAKTTRDTEAKVEVWREEELVSTNT
jgi:hypothetical protein